MNMNTSRVALLYTFWLLLGVSLAGCETFKPETFEEKLAYGYGVQTAVLNTAAMQVEAGTMTVEQGEHILAITNQSRALLDAALAMNRMGDVSAANKQLTLGITLLTELQNYLRTRAAP